MKRKILIWSAGLTIVFGAALLQSCSSDADTFATEEYGYYTEEEINAIMALAKKYGLNIELNEDYYGPKQNLSDFENEMIGLSSLLGEHELIQRDNGNGRVAYSSRKKGEDIPRSVTRFIEGEGSWSDSKSPTPLDFKINVKIKWKGDGTATGVQTSGEVKITKGSCIYSQDEERDYSSGSITTYELGMDGIGFEGSASYAAYKGKKDNPNDKTTQKFDCFGLYHFSISGGYVSIGGGGNGTFIVSGNGPIEHFKDK